MTGGLTLCEWKWPECHYVSHGNYPFAAALRRLMRKWVYTENILNDYVFTFGNCWWHRPTPSVGLAAVTVDSVAQRRSQDSLWGTYTHSEAWLGELVNGGDRGKPSVTGELVNGGERGKPSVAFLYVYTHPRLGTLKISCSVPSSHCSSPQVSQSQPHGPPFNLKSTRPLSWSFSCVPAWLRSLCHLLCFSPPTLGQFILPPSNSA